MPTDVTINRPSIVTRMSIGMRDRLHRMGEIGHGRTVSWLVEQALIMLFRELEDGVISESDIGCDLPSKTTVVSAQVFIHATWFQAMTRLSDRLGTQKRSGVIRYATTRYVSKRMSLLHGVTSYTDSLLEEGPRMPPR